MKINKDSLKARANNLSKEFSIDQGVIYNRFFFDAFLSRLAVSKYKDKFILKGGLYLSSLLGIDNRVTIDIDFYLKKLSMSKENIINIILEVALIDLDDGIKFKILDSSDIRLEDSYGGFQIRMMAKLDNVRYIFGVDIATGDPIVPSDKNYDYKCLVTGEILPLKAYSLESVVAEKLQTVLARGITNSRSKDFYDLYILNKTQTNNIDIVTLKEAFAKTCEYRDFNIDINSINELVDELSTNQQIKIRWGAFIDKNKYAYNLKFDDIIQSIRNWIEVILK